MIRHRRDDPAPLAPGISVIVPAYNEEEVIGDCLRSLAAQTAEHELVVVDDGSTDRTAEIARESGATVITGEHRGPAIARNTGAAATSGSVLVFVDADQTLAPDFLEKICAPILAGEAVSTFTRDEFVSNLDNRWAYLQGVAAGSDPRRRMPANHGPLSDVFRAIRRDAFESVGGYDDIGPGEDATVTRKLGILATRADGAICWHRNPDTLSDVFVAARWYGKSDLLPHSPRNWLRYFPPVAALRSLRRGWRHRSLALVVYLVVGDIGMFAGFVARDVLRRHHAR